jgi:hypothetical protein
MRKLFVICLLVPFVGFSQVKNVLNATRVFPRQDKITEFEKALANHAQKYHTGDWKWRVWSIESGPDAGGYMITEGPDSWSQLDSRGDLGAEHTADWEKNVAPLTQDRSGIATYTEFQPDLSTVQLTDYADKIVITHMLARPGKIAAIPDLLKKQRNVWKSDSASVAVYVLVASGDPGYLTVTRLRGGLKEMASDYRKPLKERFTAANGEGSYDAFLKDYAEDVQSRWSELLVYKPLLSSK